mmetsp:Transcript_32435/g.104950  ORF Transcript_32435/g.104950 Transcript_32435/m.104950 type:complete len:268 (-) Transcript_32435:405-1208(-)
MRSTSSRTKKRSRDSSCKWLLPSLINSHSRPGVATTTGGLDSSCRRCLSRDMPPTSATIARAVRPRCGAAEAAASKCEQTCIASSRVGVSMRANNPSSPPPPPSPPPRASKRSISRWRMGRPKARVLPEPVSAAPTTSRNPCNAAGSAAFWMGVGALKPHATIPSTRVGCRPSGSQLDRASAASTHAPPSAVASPPQPPPPACGDAAAPSAASSLSAPASAASAFEAAALRSLFLRFFCRERFFFGGGTSPASPPASPSALSVTEQP